MHLGLQDCLRWLLTNMVQAWPSRPLARQLPYLHKDLLAHVSASRHPFCL